MTVKQCGSACSQQQAAEDFLRSRLYGPGSRRTTCKKELISLLVSELLEPSDSSVFLLYMRPGNELLSLQNKRSQTKSAAVQFVKTGWGGFQCDAYQHQSCC